MPLFELDESGSRLVRPAPPASTGIGPEGAELVSHHLADLLGESLFPVARRRSPDEDRPHLLALDVVGQPVVVEVVEELDAEALVRALGYAGRAGRLTSGDLARLYEGGQERFSVDLMAFRDSLPAAYSRRGLRVGARLLLVCGDVDPEVAHALEFLRAPGRQVEVLRMGIVEGAEGRRYLDVSPLAGRIAELRQVEQAQQAQLQSPRAEAAYAEAVAYDLRRREEAARLGLGVPVPPTPEEPRAEAAVSVPTPSSPLEPPASTSPEAPASPLPPEAPTPEEPATSPTSLPRPRIENGVYVPVFVPSETPLVPPDARRLEDTGAVPPVAPSAPGPPQPAARPVRTEPRTVAPGVPANGVAPGVLPPPAAIGVPRGAPATSPFPAAPVRLGSTEQRPAPDPVPDGRLVALAALRGSLELVWFRARRGQRLTATLRRDGLIELPDGSVHADPDAAAQSAAGSAVPVDGWRVWRLGADDGPSLAEAL